MLALSMNGDTIYYMTKAPKLPKLPQLLDRKLYKSGQTRGADDDEIYQNRVGRNGTVLIPLQFWNNDAIEKAKSGFFEAGYIVLIKPADYFSKDNPVQHLNSLGLKLGKNALVFYETRQEWALYNPTSINWQPANSRTHPLGGEYIARIPATTSLNDGNKINLGYTSTKLKGAGIRQYEYADSAMVRKCRLQLEAEYWLCKDAIAAAIEFGMHKDDAQKRCSLVMALAEKAGLLDFDRLRISRIISASNVTVCPLCLEELSAYGFYNRLAQAEGRSVPDLTVTELNLFHIEELRYGAYNHRIYNLGWGHHHCNVVVKDAGILPTLQWMALVLDRNRKNGTDL